MRTKGTQKPEKAGRLLIWWNREVLLGITGKDFTLIAASKAAMRGATVLKAADDKTRSLNKHTLMAYSGEAGDTGIFAHEELHLVAIC